MSKIFVLSDAIDSLFPGTQWTLYGNDYSKLEWYSKDIEKPSLEILEKEVNRLQAEYAATEYQRLRAAEYPDYRDFLDAIVKQDTEQMRLYTEKCMQVKMKYPKPGGY